MGAKVVGGQEGATPDRRLAARIIDGVLDWVGDRLVDAAYWPLNLVSEFPVRGVRLASTAWAGVVGLVTLLPSSVRVIAGDGFRAFASWQRRRWLNGVTRLGSLAVRLLDLAGLPELFGLPWRALARSSPLTAEELASIVEIFGPRAMRYRHVRVTQGGGLRPVFALNGGRAFTLFHTISLPKGPELRRRSLEIIVHEMTHVYQHECLGSIYLGQCIQAQHGGGYGYGGEAGLRIARSQGRTFSSFNREQQAQLVQDYFARRIDGREVSAYEPYIAELRARKL